MKIIENREKLFVDRFKEIIYVCPTRSAQLQYETIKKLKAISEDVIIHEGFLSTPENLVKTTDEPSIVIFDDLFEEAANSQTFCHFMIFSARKANMSVIMTSQNLFSKGKYCLSVRRQLVISSIHIYYAMLYFKVLLYDFTGLFSLIQLLV